MPTQPKRVAAFSVPWLHRPLPILALHTPFGERTVAATLSIHEELFPTHLAAWRASQETVSCASHLSAASASMAYDAVCDNPEDGQRYDKVSPVTDPRPATTGSLSVGLSALSERLSWTSQQGHIPKPSGEPGRPGSGGYNVNEAMNWTRKEYGSFQVGVTGSFPREP